MEKLVVEKCKVTGKYDIFVDDKTSVDRGGE